MAIFEIMDELELELEHQRRKITEGFKASLEATRAISDAKSDTIRELHKKNAALEARNAKLLKLSENVTKFLRRKATEKPIEYKGQVHNLLSLEQALREVQPE